MRRIRYRRLLAVEWDTLAGIAAAFVALVMSLFGLVSEVTVRAILLLLGALILLREMRHDSVAAVHAEHLDCMRQDIRDLREKVGSTDMVVISPLAMTSEFLDFASHLSGRVTWYNACCRMFFREEMFEGTLGQLINNPDITTIEMLCDEFARREWETDVTVKVRRRGGGEKVRQPLWGHLPKAVSFLIGEHREYKRPQALMAIMEEPFASHGDGLSVPRYLFRIQNHSDILTAMAELARSTASGCGMSARRSRLHEEEGGRREDEPADGRYHETA